MVRFLQATTKSLHFGWSLTGGSTVVGPSHMVAVILTSGAVAKKRGTGLLGV